MAKKTQSEWLDTFDAVVSKGVDLAKHWGPKGASEIQKQARLASKGLQNYQTQKREAAKLKPRKSRLLWLLPLPLLPATFIALASGQFADFLINALASAMFLAAVLLTGRGFQQEVNEQRQLFQSEKRIPFKTLGGLTLALATLLTAWGSVGHSFAISLSFGVGAFAAFALLYGLDPRQERSEEQPVAGNSQVLDKEQLQALQQAEQKLLKIEQAIQNIADLELKLRLARITKRGREILCAMSRHSRDFDRARKFLNVYLEGAQKVIVGYSKGAVDQQAHPLENNFNRVLITIEQVFDKQYERLLAHDLHDLDVQIEVLETRLRNEGLG